jgi:hypothetical protein
MAPSGTMSVCCSRTSSFWARFFVLQIPGMRSTVRTFERTSATELAASILNHGRCQTITRETRLA